MEVEGGETLALLPEDSHGRDLSRLISNILRKFLTPLMTSWVTHVSLTV